MAKKINMTLNEVKVFLAEYHDENRAKIYIKHEESTEGEFLGIKISDLKKVLKLTKKNYELSKELFNTGVYDYMYLAGLMGDEKLMTKEDSCYWIEHAKYNAIAEYVVSWVISESQYALELASKYVDSDIDKVDVYVGKTSCKVPYAVEYIKKLEDKNKIGKKKKKKTVRC